jgi:hypothetical protein
MKGGLVALALTFVMCDSMRPSMSLELKAREMRSMSTLRGVGVMSGGGGGGGR